MFGNSRAQDTLLAQESAVIKNFHGNVKGVSFDFRHADLSPEDWVCPAFMTKEPRFYVVGDVESEIPTLAGTMGDLAKIGLADARANRFDILIPGDTVRADYVHIHQFNEDLLAPELDRYVAVVVLELVSSNGTRAPLAEPLLFWPRGSWTWGETPPAETLSLLAQRLGRISGGDNDEVASLASHFARVLGLRDRIAKALREVPPEQDSTKIKGLFDGVLGKLFTVEMDVNMLANEAALYGYRQGRLEAELSMAPLARGKLAHLEQARSAGRGNRDPKREKFAAEHLAEFADATVATATKAFLERYPHEDQSSVRRSFKRHFPLNRKSA